MLEYHAYMHPLTVHMVFNGLTRTLLKMTILRAYYLGHYHFKVTPVNGNYTIIANYTGPVQYLGLKITFYTGLGGNAILLAIPSLAYLLGLIVEAVVRKQEVDDKVLLTLLLAGSSLGNVLAGPVDWYTYNTLPYLYTTITLAAMKWANGLKGTRRVRIGLAFVSLNVISVALMKMGILAMSVYLK